MNRTPIRSVFKKSLAIVTSLALVVSLSGAVGCSSAATEEIETEEVPFTSGDDELTIVANAAHILSESGNLITYYYPDLVVTNSGDSNIRSITVQFTTEIESGDKVTFDVNGVSDRFVIFGTKDGNKSVNSVSDQGLTAADWQSYLREHMTITLNRNDNMVKGLRMIASLSPVTRTLDYNSANGHYYELISGYVPWHEARYLASQKTYLGMRGYLANITSVEENRLLGSLVGAATWIGATSWPDFISTEDTTPSSAFTIASHKATLSNAAYRAFPTTTVLDTRAGAVSTAHTLATGTITSMDWYWVTGPEAYEKDENGNLKTDENGEIIYHPQFFTTGQSAANKHNNSVLVDPADASKGYYFSWWSSGEPNNSGPEYVAHMLTTAPSGDASNKYWNDYYPDNSSATAYLVEYGGLEQTDLAAAGKETTTGSANANVDVYVKLDIDIDTSGKTMTTTVDDLYVGDNQDKPLPIIESVNGDMDIKTVYDDGTTESVTPTHTFYIQDSEAEGGWREMTADELNENGEPYHAGTYKIQSTAVYSYDAAGEEVLYRGGTATFKIKPKQLDLTATQTPLVTKVYDGTTVADTSLIDISSFVLPGADVAMVSDPTGVYDAVSVKDASKVTVANAVLTGEDAGDYVLVETETEGVIEVKGAVTPRTLVLTTSANASWGLEGEKLLGSSGDALAYKTDLAIHQDTEADWPVNELAARDALSLTETILGAVAFEPRAGDVRLDADNPTAGLYDVFTYFANVNPGGKATGTLTPAEDATEGEGDDEIEDDQTPMASLQLLAEDPEGDTDDSAADPAVTQPALDTISATKLSDGSYDIGNYILTIVEPRILITADPLKEDDFDKTTEFIDGVVTEKVDPAADRLPDEKILDLVKEVAGERLPSGEPVIVITKDGKPVEAIDPSEPGTYAIVATYPGDDGSDTVVRVAYNVSVSDPLSTQQTIKVAKNPEAAPLSKQDIDALMKERLGSWVPGTEATVVSITKDGQSQSEIDLTTPGVYKVVLTYMDDDGCVREVELTYEVMDIASGAPVVEETINIPVEPGGKPITEDDIIEKVKETYGDIVPDGVDPIIVITRDGEPVDAIDPSVPGVYEVTITYPGADGEEDKVIKLVYTYYDDSDGEGDGAGDGTGTGSPDDPDGVSGGDGFNGSGDDGSLGSPGTNGTDGTPSDGEPGVAMPGTSAGGDGQPGSSGSGSGVGSSATSGAKGFNDIAGRLLAQTGDPVFLTVCGVAIIAIVAGAVVIVSRRKRAKEDR